MTTETYFLGVDGGGTFCRVRLVSSDGRVIGEETSGSANTTSGVENAFSSILDATNAIINSCGLDKDIYKNTYAGLGLAGLIDSTEIKKVESFHHPFCSLTANSDGYAACLGAHAGNDGGIAIFGTGSNCLGINKGKIINVGGWGFLISDHGSGAQLGLNSIRTALLAADDVIPHSPFTLSVMDAFDKSPGNAVRWCLSAKPKEFGEFAKLAVDYQKQGDPEALALVKQTAYDAERLIQTLVNKGIQKVVLLGGLSPHLVSFFSEEVTNLLCDSKGDAMDGAILMAKRIQKH